MMQANFPEKNLILVGGGHAHVEVLRAAAMLERKNWRLTLVSPASATYYSGMLPGYIAGEYNLRDITIDLEPLSRKASAIFYRSLAQRLDPEQRILYLEKGVELQYDAISFDIGSASQNMSLDERDHKIITTRPFPRLLESLQKWDEILQHTRRRVRIACIGGGAAGFELILALQKRYHDKYLRQELELILYDSHRDYNSRKKQILLSRGISAKFGNRITRVVNLDAHLELEMGDEKEAADLALWATGPRAQPFFTGSPLANAAGYLAVNSYLQSTKFKNIFGAGDCIDFEDYPRVDKAGVFAVREGPILSRNLFSFLADSNCSLQSYQPQKVYLRLLNLSDQSARLEYGALSHTRKIYWKLKDSIDRKFMRKYSARPLPPLVAPDCGGCGGKVGGDILGSALACISVKESSDVLIGLRQPDDIALIKVGGTQLGISIDYFKDLGISPYDFGRIAAVHATNDLYAKGILPKYALANFALPKASPMIMKNDLQNILLGAQTLFIPENIQILGGQTNIASELAAGFTILGEYSSDKALWKKQGLRSGDALIITKALGTGVLLAALMRFAARGEDWDLALREMQESGARVSEILRNYPISAATDLSGFGLAGHLQEMLGFRQKAKIFSDKIPLLPGVKELLAQGYMSRMAIENERAYPWPGMDPIFYDPQTAGGMLFGIATEFAEQCLRDLHRIAPAAAIIGEVK